MKKKAKQISMKRMKIGRQQRNMSSLIFHIIIFFSFSVLFPPSTCYLFIFLLFQPTSLDVARGFGMRVVGGKTGTDGRLFAYLVWTVPGGPAEKMGLQQGDKVSQHFLIAIKM